MGKHKVGESSLDRPRRLLDLLESVPILHRARLERETVDIRLPPLVDFSSSGEEYLELVHDPTYIQEVKRRSQRATENSIVEVEGNFYSNGTFLAAAHAVGAAVTAAQRAKHGYKAFALVRPPGHHAHSNYGHGFCYFNNIAIAAEHLRTQGERVMIVDIDLHFGDGTEEYSTGRDDVYHFSISQGEIWPFPSNENQENNELIFLPGGTQDPEYQRVLERRLSVAIDQWKPSMIAVSAGFDTSYHDSSEFGDLLEGGFNLTRATYDQVWQILDSSLVPYFAVLEGGYSSLALQSGIESFLEKDN